MFPTSRGWLSFAAAPVLLAALAAPSVAQRTVASRGVPVRPPAVMAEEIRWRARLLRMVDAQQLDMALVDSALASTIPAVRAQTALAAGQIPEASLSPAVQPEA